MFSGLLGLVGGERCWESHASKQARTHAKKKRGGKSGTVGFWAHRCNAPFIYILGI